MPRAAVDIDPTALVVFALGCRALASRATLARPVDSSANLDIGLALNTTVPLPNAAEPGADWLRLYAVVTSEASPSAALRSCVRPEAVREALADPRTAARARLVADMASEAVRPVERATDRLCAFTVRSALPNVA